MNIHNYRFLLSERGTLKRLISGSPPDDMIGRVSLQYRLRQVEEELEAYKGYSPRLVNARLTFRGKPVVGGRGVNANFAAETVNAFARSVARIGAGWRAPLPPTGRIPDSAEFQLLVTGTTPGSFGFQLEDAAQQPALMGQDTPVALAIGKVKEILEASIKTDDELSETIADTDRRALQSIRKFLKRMADNDAVCALEFQGNEFHFRDVAQVKRSENRLSDDNIREDDVVFGGYFEGFLPKSRRAEFFIAETDADFLREAVGAIISGRVLPGVDETVKIKEIIDQYVTVNARVRRVGEGRPRYVVTDCELRS